MYATQHNTSPSSLAVSLRSADAAVCSTPSNKLLGFWRDELFPHCLHFSAATAAAAAAAAAASLHHFLFGQKGNLFMFVCMYVCMYVLTNSLTCIFADHLIHVLLLLFFISSPTHSAWTEDVTFQGPRWRAEPSDLVLPVNSPEQRATLTCEAEGSPPPQYR